MNVEAVATRNTGVPPEVLLVARRLALRLGCSTALLAAPEHLEGADALSPALDVRFVAAPEALESVEERAQHRQIHASTDGDLLVALPLDRTVIVLSPDTLAEQAETALGLAARQAAATIVGASSHWAPGPPGVAELRHLAATRGLDVIQAGLLQAAGDPASRRDSPFVVAAGAASRDRVRELMRAGPHSLALDPQIDVSACAPRPARVCIASYEVVGPTKNGGIGTANTSLAQALARAGHDVTLLFTGGDLPKSELEAWRRHYESEGIQFHLLPHAGRAASPHPNVRRSFELLEWLARQELQRPYDVLHYPDCQGHGYYPALAKKHGLALQDTQLVAGVHSSTRWVFEANREPMRSVEAMVDEHLEQDSVALADVVVSPSSYLVGYLRERGWTLPKRCFVQQYALPTSVAGFVGGAETRDGRPSELVFFGRLEVRKGVEAFCDALDSLAANPHGLNLQITFMGKAQHILTEPAEAYVERRGERWPWPWRITSDLPHAAAIDYLRSRPCVAVIPSLVDNSPNTVTEALALGIPLVTSRTGGTGELIHADDLGRCTFDGWLGVETLQPPQQFEPTARFDSEPLAARLRAVLGEPGRSCRFAVDPTDNAQVHVGWHAGVAAASTDRGAQRWSGNGGGRRENGGVPAVTVSVCVLHRDEADGLRQTLSALERQDRLPSDVLVLDQGSRSRAGRVVVDAVEKLGDRRAWQVIRGDDAGAGSDLNDACARLAGEVIIFVRAGDCPQSDLVRRVADAACRTEADLLSFPVWNALGDEAPAVLLPIGGPALLGLLYPTFSVGCFAARKAALARLHGFAPDSRAEEAEHELLNRALLSGFRLEVVPRPLATRVVPDRWAAVRTAKWAPAVPWHYDSDQQLRLARAFAAALPPGLREFPSLLRGFHDGNSGVRVEFQEQARHLRLQHERLQELESWIDHLEGELRDRRLARFLAARMRAAAARLRCSAGRVKRRLLLRS